jgi:multidrug resistance efflux pump
MKPINFLETVFEETKVSDTPNSFKQIYRIEKKNPIKYWSLGIGLLLIVLAFLPWTQNIKSKGNTTTLRQENKPQKINSVIAGKIVKWYVQEGDMVAIGDTIARLQEVKIEYLDPLLLKRTQEQLSAKQRAIGSYQQKAQTSGQQLSALVEAQKVKSFQLRNKIQQTQAKIKADSADMLAARNEANIAIEQLTRQKKMYEQGLVSLTQLEQRTQAYQNALAKRVSVETKYNNSKQDLQNALLDIKGIEQEYNEKRSKAEGERFQAYSQISTGEADIAKLENQYQNYRLRNEMYYIIAPQTGQIVKAQKAGIGEIVKEGDYLLEIIPQQNDFAVEMFISPLDIPLLQKGQKVQLLFDGYPAIVFSGWPQQSFGTFSGEITFIENSIGTNGTYRVLVTPLPNARKWPSSLRFGTAAQTFTLLKDVPLAYEIWRNINGFPPEYYKNSISNSKKDTYEKK